MIKLCQEWSRTAWMPAGLHDWDQFITPDELRAALARHGLQDHDMKGMAPGVPPPVLYRRLRQLKKGRFTCAEFGRRVPFELTGNLQVSYIGYATRPAVAANQSAGIASFSG